MDDVGLDDVEQPRTFGPETLFLSGKLSRFPPGKYALMVNPKPETRNPKPETRNLKTQALRHKPHALRAKP